jgi:hypothetical protein
MLKAAVSIAFFSLLRCSEFTSTNKSSWDPTTELSIQDIVKVDGTKTDPIKTGCEIEFVKLKNEFCPVTNLKTYLRGPTQDLCSNF